MSNGARRAPQEIRMDFAVLPETNCQGLLALWLEIFSECLALNIVFEHTPDLILCCFFAGAAEMDQDGVSSAIDGATNSRNI